MMPVRGKERDRKKREEVGVIRVVVVFYVWINPNSFIMVWPLFEYLSIIVNRVAVMEFRVMFC